MFNINYGVFSFYKYIDQTFYLNIKCKHIDQTLYFNINQFLINFPYFNVK